MSWGLAFAIGVAVAGSLGVLGVFIRVEIEKSEERTLAEMRAVLKLYDENKTAELRRAHDWSRSEVNDVREAIESGVWAMNARLVALENKINHVGAGKKVNGTELS